MLIHQVIITKNLGEKNDTDSILLVQALDGQCVVAEGMLSVLDTQREILKGHLSIIANIWDDTRFEDYKVQTSL